MVEGWQEVPWSGKALLEAAAKVAAAKLVAAQVAAAQVAAM